MSHEDYIDIGRIMQCTGGDRFVARSLWRDTAVTSPPDEAAAAPPDEAALAHEGDIDISKLMRFTGGDPFYARPLWRDAVATPSPDEASQPVVIPPPYELTSRDVPFPTPLTPSDKVVAISVTDTAPARPDEAKLDVLQHLAGSEHPAVKVELAQALKEAGEFRGIVPAASCFELQTLPQLGTFRSTKPQPHVLKDLDELTRRPDPPEDFAEVIGEIFRQTPILYSGSGPIVIRPGDMHVEVWRARELDKMRQRDTAATLPPPSTGDS